MPKCFDAVAAYITVESSIVKNLSVVVTPGIPGDGKRQQERKVRVRRKSVVSHISEIVAMIHMVVLRARSMGCTA